MLTSLPKSQPQTNNCAWPCCPKIVLGALACVGLAGRRRNPADSETERHTGSASWRLASCLAKSIC
eukprot:8482708-Pyramimonas_sp.AAC.1